MPTASDTLAITGLISNPRVPSDQNERTGDDTSSKHPIQFFHPGQHPGIIPGTDLRKRNYFCCFTLLCSCRCPAAQSGTHFFFCECIPFFTNRTLPQPFCLFMSAILTEKNTFLSFCHILLHKKELNAVFIHSPSSLLLLIIKCLLLLQSAFFYFDVHSFPFADLNTDTQLSAQICGHLSG